ncbi:MAG: S-methyl-5'-thioadenosine phosphorylase [Nannocystaceae bacterium]
MSSPHPASAAARSRLVLGVIGGSGLYDMEQLEGRESVAVDTPFGGPSAAFSVGHIQRDGAEPIKVVFLPRHGAGHRLLPGEINYRANIHGLKQLGVTHLLAVSAVGSLKETICPGDVVLPDQFIDLTRHRRSTFFGDGLAAHVQLGSPTCPAFRQLTAEAVGAEGGTLHDGGTCVVMEGPAFSTRAESELYRGRWAASVVGMTAMPEAKLAREAEMAYTMVAMSTDYDCWHVGHEEVSVAALVAVMQANVRLARCIVGRVARTLPQDTDALPYPHACARAIITAPDAIDEAAKSRLDLIVGHYL